MYIAINWLESIFNSIPLPFLEVWGRFGYVLGILIMVAAFGGFTFRPGGRWGIGRERQAWDVKAVLSIVFTFLLIFITGFVGSFVVLVPGAQTFESLKDLSVFLCIVLFGYPALLAVPFAYGLSDLIEGVPPEFLGDWILGYFINPSCFWVAYQLIGRNPDFRKMQTWAKYFLFVLIFLMVEPALWGYLCSEQFTSEISYRNITPALFFTTGITWVMAPFAMLVAFPLAKRYGMFWAEIPGHVKELLISYKEWVWESGRGEVLKDVNRNTHGMPLRIFLVTPFIVLVLMMVAATAYLTLSSSQNAADKLACRLHEEISEHIRLQLDNYLNRSENKNEIPNHNDINRLLWKTSIAEHGRAFVIDRFGMLVASSRELIQNPDDSVSAANSGDLVIRNVVRNLNHNFGNLAVLENTNQFRFDIVTAKPLSRETWLAQVSPYRDSNRNINWLVVTAIPTTYYLEGILTGNSRSAMVFAIALTLSLLIAVVLAGIVAAPIQRISDASQAIASGDLSQRVPGSRLEELGALSASFNHMAEQLHESFDRTKMSQKQFRDLVDTTPGIVWEADAVTFTFTFVSQQVESLLGYTVREWEEPGFWADHLHPEDRDRAVEYCVACTGRLEAHDFEYRFICKDGRIVWLHDLVKVISSDNKPKWLRGVMVDVTERKQIEEKLKERSQFIESILNITPDILYIYDLDDGKSLYSNTGIRGMFGYSAQELEEMGGEQRLKTLFHEDDYHDFITNIIPKHKQASDKDLIERHYRIKFKDGTLHWFVSKELVYKRNQDGVPTQIFGITTDVTESKHAEETILDLNANLERKIEIRTEELKKSNENLVLAIQHEKKVMKELEETQGQLLVSEKLAALGQLAAGMTHELNTPLGAIMSSNRAILGILNHELKDIPDFLSSLNEEDSNRFKIILAESLKDATSSESLPNRALKKQFIQSFKSAGIKNYENIADTVMDIGVYRLGEELTALLDTEKNSDILKTVSSLSTVVRLSNVISIATGKASHVVDALKNYLNPDGNVKDEEITSVDIIAEIESILTLYHGKIKYGVEVIKNFNVTDRCLGNGNKLNQVWINLLNNGLQSMNYEGKLEINIEKQDSWIVTSFIDSGNGVSDEIKDKIFDPFFTTKKHGEGIGLGLDISKKIVEKFGGKIEFESAPGRTKFSVFLRTASSSI
ncbi:PAS domain-containing protein [Leptospira sp. 'Mane']|uniref:PAS domain-containing protein n=1 Tax=Leptospira sp. 'Mane' TaxID=3387407 RepID=UPI00398B7A32